MTVPLIVRIGALVLATTAFYTYVGQMVPQKEVQPPQETALGSDMTTADMVKVGREIMEGKGICLTCHTVGKSGALRFPDLGGIGVQAKNRVPGLSDVEYLAQSMYEPTAFVVPGFPPAMPPVNQPPIGLTDQEILCVIAALQSLGGTPTVTLKTTHKYFDGTTKKGARLRPATLQLIAAHRAVRTDRFAIATPPQSEPGAPQAHPAGPPSRERFGASAVAPAEAEVEQGDGAAANDGVGGSGGAKPPGGTR